MSDNEGRNAGGPIRLFFLKELFLMGARTPQDEESGDGFKLLVKAGDLAEQVASDGLGVFLAELAEAFEQEALACGGEDDFAVAFFSFLFGGQVVVQVDEADVFFFCQFFAEFFVQDGDFEVAALELAFCFYAPLQR